MGGIQNHAFLVQVSSMPARQIQFQSGSWCSAVQDEMEISTGDGIYLAVRHNYWFIFATFMSQNCDRLSVSDETLIGKGKPNLNNDDNPDMYACKTTCA